MFQEHADARTRAVYPSHLVSLPEPVPHGFVSPRLDGGGATRGRVAGQPLVNQALVGGHTFSIITTKLINLI